MIDNIKRDRKQLLAVSAGTLLEWAEFIYYAYIMIQVSHLFFFMMKGPLRLLMVFTSFAVSYLARPLGGILFGHIADRWGRRPALSASIFMMSMISLMMGLLPTAHTIGLFAPILLMLLRFLQGLSVAGEFSSGAVFLLESSHSKRPYFVSSWISSASAMGMLVGSGFALLVAIPMMPAWAWRVPFLLGALGSFFAFYIRRQLSETSVYEATDRSYQQKTLPFLSVFRSHRLAFLQVFIIAVFVGVYIYICNVWWISYAVEQAYFSSFQARLMATFGQACVIILIPLFAIWADRHQYTQISKQFVCMGSLGAVIVAPMLFFVTTTQQIIWVALLEIGYAICNALISSVMFQHFTKLFPASVRCTGQAVAWNSAVAVFGGTAPLLAQYFINIEWYAMPALYVSITALLACGFTMLFNKHDPSNQREKHHAIITGPFRRDF